MMGQDCVLVCSVGARFRRQVLFSHRRRNERDEKDDLMLNIRRPSQKPTHNQKTLSVQLSSLLSAGGWRAV